MKRPGEPRARSKDRRDRHGRNGAAEVDQALVSQPPRDQDPERGDARQSPADQAISQPMMFAPAIAEERGSAGDIQRPILAQDNAGGNGSHPDFYEQSLRACAGRCLRGMGSRRRWPASKIIFGTRSKSRGRTIGPVAKSAKQRPRQVRYSAIPAEAEGVGEKRMGERLGRNRSPAG